MAVKLNQHDLQFILKQIKIAEAHSSGIPLNEVRVDANGNYDPTGTLAITQPHLPYGLRTVDGTYNNIIPGRELWGAADQTMPRMFDPNWNNEGDGDQMPFGGGPGAPVVDNTDYGVVGSPGAGNGGHSGNVADADPRIISNLIVDQTPNNPSAVIAALRFAEFEGTTEEMNAAVASIMVPYALLNEVYVATHRVASLENTIATLIEAIAALPPGVPVPDGLGGALAGAQGALAIAQPVLDAAITAADGAQAELDAAALALGIEFEIDGKTLKIPNIAPDEGLSAPFNGWMTFFGQFFDHGLDLISKGGNGTIYVPLEEDDPLYVPGGHTNFMVLTRATPFNGPGEDGVLGTADDTTHEGINVTTPFVDQNQTYTSHPSHQVFLREYMMVDGRPMATGRMLDGANGGLPTWADVKHQAKTMLGIELTDRDVFNIPLIRTDLYGEFIRDANGFPQVITNIGPDGIPNTEDDIVTSGTPSTPVQLNPATGGTEPVRTSHAFLDDIAHNAVPVLDTQGNLFPDGIPDGLEVDPAGNAVQFDPLTGDNQEYDNELLDRHFITGDGRGNENIGLTAVHHVFHSEHNRQISVNKLTILQSGDLDFINEWMLEGSELDQTQLDSILAGMTGNLEHYLDDLSSPDVNGEIVLNWDGERLFQTARFATEMQYQHLVFEEFGRKIQPMIDVFVFNTITDIDPAIFAEFANVVYRFGHSMLTEEIARMFLDDQGNPVHYNEAGEQVAVPVEVGGTLIGNWGQDIGLIEAFLNPIEFDKDGDLTHEQAAGAIFRGMSLVRGNEIDEFIVDALRNNLLGLPLDLASINIARGRDTGMPTLNQARQQLYEASNSTFVKPYESWAEFAANLKNPASIINFIAAYGTHQSIIDAGDNLEARRAAATALVLGDGAPAGDVTINDVTYTNRLDFLNATGEFAGGSLGGLNNVDLWIGGLAEKKMPFGGMLGSTFNAVFEAQLELLQDLDRFYYLTRTQGLNLLNELENNAFSKLIIANTDMTDPGPDGIRGTSDDGPLNFPTGVDSFATHDYVLNIDPDKQVEADPEHEDEHLNALGLTKVQRDNLLTADVDESTLNNYIRFIGGEHTAIGGSSGNDTIISDFGDDAIWGGSGDDRIESGAGVDFVIGGDGNDIITDSGDTGDFIKGEDGDDIIANSNGLDVLMGGDGKDFFFIGVDGTEVFAGEGDDFILGGADIDFLMGNEGSDWIEGGDGFDTIAGENSELFFNSSILGHDVAFAGENENDFDMESGDDIMVQGESVMRNEGMFGFDWAIHKDNRVAADSDMRIPIFTTVADNILRDRFDQTEALSGWIHNDVLRGDDRGSKEEIEIELDMTNHELTQAGVDRIDGLRELLGNLLAEIPEGFDGDLESLVAFKAGNILIGGDGNDTIEGRGGDDFIHGDAWLNVRIRITEPGEANEAGNEIATVDTLKHVFAAGELNSAGQPIPEAWVGKSIFELMLARVIVPNQMHIVREILYDEDPSNNVDTAIFAGNRDWYEVTELDDGSVRVSRREMEEVDPQIDEGNDTLVGIERIQFADQTMVLEQSGNYEPSGRLVISGLPARENVPLTVSAAEVYDANNPGAGPGNVGNIIYRWQIERNDGTGDYINIPGSSGISFTPNDEHTGLRIRVIGTYVDAGGVTETVTSQPTDVVLGVDDEPSGPLLISDMSPTEGQALTATVAFTDPDGLTDAFEEGLLTYQWQWSATGAVDEVNPELGWNDIGEPSLTATLSGDDTADMGGRYLRVKVVYSDDLLNEHTVYSAVTSVVGNVIEAAGTINESDGVTAGDDAITGSGGVDAISGLGGGDVVNAGVGDDTLNGGDGNDVLNGEGGNDDVNGEAGDDTIVHHVGDGSDSVDGGAGNDTLRIVGARADRPVDVVAVAFNGAHITSIGGIASTIDGADSSIGSATIVQDGPLSTVEHVNLDLGTGGDTLSYEASAADVEVDLLAGTASGFSYIRNVENVVGGLGDDTLRGNNDSNEISGGEGADTVRGGFGNDEVNGDAGHDLVYGEKGDDVLNGGLGNDRIDGGEGSDTASYAGAATGVTVSLANTETTVEESPDTIGAGNDLLVDIENLTGSSHDDTLTGNAGNNVIDGGLGADAMAGGVGDDTYVVDNVGDEITEDAAGGNDTVRTALGSYVLHANVENVVLTGGENEDVTGNDGDNELTGNSGDNVLDGGGGIDTVVLDGHITDHSFALVGGNIQVTSASGGTDTLVNIERVKVGGAVYDIVDGTNGVDNPLSGTAANELLLGFNGVDTINGGDGADILVGGVGGDDMLGEGGDDTFVVNQGGDYTDGGAGVDTVYSTISRNINAVAQAAAIENVTLVGSANINAVGNALDNVLTGNEGDNTLSGAGGVDTLVGNAGNDILNGGGANDSLEGGDGDDTLNGQGGALDVAVFAGSAGDYSFGMDGALITVTHSGAGGTDTLNNIERMQFGGGESVAILVGTDADEDLTASSASAILGLAGSDTIVGSDGDDIIIGGEGDDNLTGSDVGEGDNAVEGALDDDIFVWNVGDGFDTIHGGFEGDAGDAFVVNGNAETETFRIYTYDEAAARIGYAGDDENEIVVTREGEDGVETVIAELTEIEEIIVNGVNVGSNGSSDGDTFEIYGNFDTTTSLRPNTITITGSSSDDTINLSSLLSAHRIVFKTKGGNDTIIGTLRPQDVIELPDGMSIADFEVTIEDDGLTTLVGGGHTITFVAPDGVQYSGGDDDDEDDDDGLPGNDGNDGDDDDDDIGNDDEDPTDGDDDDDTTDGDDDDDQVTPPATGSIKTGTPQADVLVGTAGDDDIVAFGGDDVAVGDAGADNISASDGVDFISAGAGNDKVFAGAGDDQAFGGDGDDTLFGEAGADRVFGDGGNDIITSGAGDDTVFGGAGNDLILAEINDGNDVYFGEGGSDTVDMSAATTAVTVNLGVGPLGNGTATGSQIGSDVLWGIENVNTGSGSDTIVASNATNVMNGGGGNDVFRFNTTAAADGDFVLGFEPGDRLDFGGIDADLGVDGDQAFTIIAGDAFTAAGQLAVSFVSRDDGDFTVIQGNVGGDLDVEFTIEIEGHHTPTGANTTL